MTWQNTEVLHDDPTIEMPGSFETPLETAEFPPLTPGEQQLLEAITFPEDLQADWHERFNTAIENTLGSCIDPTDQKYIKAAASLMEWRWFSKPGDPLPEGVVLSVANAPMFISSELESRYSAVATYLLHAVVLDLDNERTVYFHGTMVDPINDALTKAVKETPAYELLHALASEVPEPKDVPLTIAQRTIRESQEEDFVRRTYALQKDDSLKVHHDANGTFQRRKLLIDDEQVRRVEKSTESDPKQRLMNYVLEVLNEHRPTEGEDIVSIGLCELRYDTDFKGASVSGDEVNIDLDMFLASRNWVNLTEINGDRRLEHYDSSGGIIYRLATGLLDPANARRSALEILERAVAPREATYDMFRSGGFVAPLKSYLQQPDVPVCAANYPRYIDWSPHSETSDGAWVYDNESLQEAQRAILGEVYGSTTQSSLGRVITGVRRPDKLYPKHVKNSHLILSISTDTAQYEMYYFSNGLYDVRPNEVEPHIPGYQVVGHNPDRNTWYFNEAEVDPYRGSAKIEIEAADKAALVDQIRAIGMNRLANTLESTAKLDLAMLVRMVQGYSDYTFDNKYNLGGTDEPHFTDNDFQNLVDERARLQVQCTGAATFLKHILRTTLPSSPTTIISGKAINHNGQVPSVGHSQILVAHKGRQFIIDATPPSRQVDVFGGAADGSSDIGRKNTRADRNNPFVPEQSPISMSEVEPEFIGENAAILQAEKVQHAKNVTQRCKQLLKAHFNFMPDVADEVLYDKVVKLKKGADPVRRVLELVLQSEASEHVTLEDVENTRAYIISMQNADRALFKRVGIPQYNMIFLKSLNGILADLLLKVKNATLQ